jgi:hypothetical protein
MITAAERERRRQRILEIRPWEKSTGAKTAEGKQKSRMNAFKHGCRSRHRATARRANELKKRVDEARQELERAETAQRSHSILIKALKTGRLNTR